MEFKAKIENGVPVVQAITERIKNKNGGWDVVIHAPSLKLMNKFGKEQDGKRNLQPIQG